MDLQLRGKFALVTGASKGLGLAIAHELAAEGCNLAICARDRAEIDAAAKEIDDKHGVTAHPFVVDVTAPDQVAALVDDVQGRTPRVDILVNNAGRAYPGRFPNLSDENFVDDYAIKVLSHVRMIRAFLPLMTRPGGRIININSIHGHHADPRFFTSSVNRAASIALAKSLSLELADDGILVNSVNIGYALTPQWHNVHQRRRPDMEFEEFIRDSAEQDIPLKRFAEPEEVGAVVAFLASGRASYLTGISVDVGGGMGVA